MGICEAEVADGNVSVGELAVLASFAADCEEGEDIFEIGTFDGRTTLNLALNAPEECTVHTLDLPRERETVFRLLDADQKYVDKPRSGTRIERYRRTRPAVTQKIRQLFGDSAAFDFSPFLDACALVFVDGSHAYDYVLSDSRAAMSMARPGGVVVWHDYGMWEDVTAALNDLAREEGHALSRIAGTSLVYWRKPAS